MPLAHKTSALPEALKNQIANNFAKDTEEEPTEKPVIERKSAPSEKGKYSDVINLHLSAGKRLECKKFFTEYEVTMNQGFEMAVDYVMRETKAGRLSVSKSGIYPNT